MSTSYKKKNLSRIIAGIKAKTNGKSFEDLLIFYAESRDWEVIQIPSGARWVSANKAIPVKTPFDFIFANQGKVIFFDAKTIENHNFSYSNLKSHQVEILGRLDQNCFIAGYIVNLQTIEAVVFFSAKTLLNLKPGHSLGIDDGIILSTNGSFIDFDMLF